MRTVLFITTALLCLSAQSSYAQGNEPQTGKICGTAEGMKALYDAYPSAKAEAEALEIFTQQFTQQQAKSTANPTYTIPCVFHVYGSTQGGYPITDALIQLALDGVNDDFNGKNSDYGTVHNQFKALRSTLDIKFVLAKLDPSGNPTTGVLYYPVKTGYASLTKHNAEIAQESWDNYKYLNVFVMEDLYGDGITNNSGYSFYPNNQMNDSGFSRIIYNGRYLATNNTANPEFASVLTHEFAHYFNLQHTFEGGCTTPNDNVSDTPPCTTAQGCHSSATANAPLNCNNDLVNAENYMDYNTNCYKMFTKGQVTRMMAGLNHTSRITLWDYGNLVATGLVGINDIAATAVYNVYPNPNNGSFGFDLGADAGEYCSITITDVTGREVYSDHVSAATRHYNVDITGQQPGLYLLFVQTDNSGRAVQKIHIR
ncbi:MAG: T9SS type A sorting domain-containing protein [Chitinophagales bacterium]|nr:T9SS type A sorting domain-containing protein [Chitinophagales bacterium]